ncbi:MAG: hypothetical protein HDT21_03125 [Ruminococcus sp.]|nr:hypothetical protein [Ruminococcus sp.]
MKNKKMDLSLKLAYDTDKDNIIISLDDDKNSITIPSPAYMPFISVLIKAGIDFQRNKVVDLGLSDLVKIVEEK